ncbi:MAG TPA: hydroxymethylbilane synthase [Candidatus Eisenbacteria bacterium]|nr:hydroxymethylbilane synthase [Candidatus Eisenbacteria bacterium]
MKRPSPAARKTFRLGTRGSRLALAQSGEIRRRLAALWPRLRFETVVVKTTGDEFQGVELFRKSGVGVFTKAIEKKLLSGEIDFAVHSLKDLPTDLPKGLVLAAVPRRLDPGDVLLSKKRHTLSSLPSGAVVGTGSPRRKRQILLARPDLEARDLRGNLDTRVRKMLDGEVDAIVVARAGLLRLKKFTRYARPIPTSVVLPAVGQAALAIEARRTDAETIRLLRRLSHAPTEIEVAAERAFLKALRGGCRVPVGILTTVRGRSIRLRAAVFSVNSSDFMTGRGAGPASRAEAVGRSLAASLLKKGAARFLRQARERA